MGTPGHIITFYSYKGGTGRSMAVANVGWILASRGRKVLIVDWDLEAPGVIQYFHPFVDGAELRESPGVIDFVVECATDAVNRQRHRTHERRSELADRINILRYVLPIDWQFGAGTDAGGKLHLLTSGRQGASYATRVNTFNWQIFYAERNGRAYLDVARDQVRDAYDYILVDSRTGVSDTSGICTVHIPDMLAVFFTLNTQSIEGVARTVASVQRHWEANPRTRNGRKWIFPFITRVESTELDKLHVARNYVRSKFDPLLKGQGIHDLEGYWIDAESPYVPYYAFEEVLAVFKDRPRDTSSILAACERIAAHITHGKITSLAPPSFEDKQRVVAEFAREPETIPVLTSPETSVPSAPLWRRLRQAIEPIRRHPFSFASIVIALFALTQTVAASYFALQQLRHADVQRALALQSREAADLARARLVSLIEAEAAARMDAATNARLAMQEAQKQLTELQTKIESLAALEKQSGLNEEQKALLTTLQGQFQTKREGVQEAERQLAKLETEIESLEGRPRLSEEDKIELATLRERLEAQRSVVEAARVDLAELQTEIELLESLEAQPGLSEEDKIELATLRERLEAQRSVVEAARVDAALAEDDANRLQQELNKLER